MTVKIDFPKYALGFAFFIGAIWICTSCVPDEAQQSSQASIDAQIIEDSEIYGEQTGFGLADADWSYAGAAGDVTALEKMASTALAPNLSPQAKMAGYRGLESAAEMAALNGKAEALLVITAQLGTHSLPTPASNAIIERAMAGAVKGGHAGILESLVQKYGANNITPRITQLASYYPESVRGTLAAHPNWGSDDDYKNTIAILRQHAASNLQSDLTDEALSSHTRNYLLDGTGLYSSARENEALESFLAKKNLEPLISKNMRQIVFERATGPYAAVAMSMESKTWGSIDGEGLTKTFSDDELKMFEVGANADGTMVYANPPFAGRLMNEVMEAANISGRQVEWMYVVNPEGKMYVVMRDAERGIYHSSMARGRSVVAAGTLEFDAKGVLRVATESSGHYRFKDHITIAAYEMQKMGVDVSDVSLKASDLERLAPTSRIRTSQVLSAVRLSEARLRSPVASGMTRPSSVSFVSSSRITPVFIKPSQISIGRPSGPLEMSPSVRKVIVPEVRAPANVDAASPDTRVRAK